MAKIRTFSRTFPAYHPKAGQPTHFVEKFYNGVGLNYRNKPWLLWFLSEINPNKPKELIEGFIEFLDWHIEDEKHHTIRAKKHFLPVDNLQLAVWSGVPYYSPQIKIYTEIQIIAHSCFIEDGEFGFIDLLPGYYIETIAANDGLSVEDFKAWFNKPFEGQVLCFKRGLY